MAGPVTKLDIADTTVLQSKTATRDLLLANGFADNDNTWNIASAVTHLAYTYGPPTTTHVSIHIEFNPGHFLVIVDQL